MSYAKDPSPSQVNLKKIINKEVSYPETAVNQKIEGEVTVEFKVTDDGKIEVINCYTDQGVFYTHMMKTLESIKLNPDDELTGKTFSMKFIFKLAK
jgi:TonB family protein